MAFPHHLVVRARCSKRWRGANFDQAAAEGNVGAALAAHWGIDVRAKDGLEQLLRRAIVRSYGERREENPTWSWDPSIGEAFEFHVGLREPMPEAELAQLRALVEKAVAESRSFSVATDAS